MKVTVTETIEHSADITAAMIIAYALRHGWFIVRECPVAVDLGAVEPEDFIVVWRNGAELGKRVAWLARHEHRKPHEVLADIAEGR